MRRGPARPHDVPHRHAAGRQGIGQERSVATPGHRLGAHHRHRSLVRQLAQLAQALLELGGEHVVGEAPEAGVAPGAVGRVRSRAAQPPEPRQVPVVDALPLQRLPEGLLVVLGVVARARHGSDVGQDPDAVGGEDLHQLGEGAGRMADGEDPRATPPGRSARLPWREHGCHLRRARRRREPMPGRAAGGARTLPGACRLPPSGGRKSGRSIVEARSPWVEVSEKARAGLAEALRQDDGARYVRIRPGRG